MHSCVSPQSEFLEQKQLSNNAQRVTSGSVSTFVPIFFRRRPKLLMKTSFGSNLFIAADGKQYEMTSDNNLHKKKQITNKFLTCNRIHF